MDKRKPDCRNVSYDFHERNRIDLWQAESSDPTPGLVYFHAGGFRFGDKNDIPAAIVNGCLEERISVASAGYRLSQHARYPASMLDGVRAVQFLRSKAEEWNIDKTRIAAGGCSAGGGISLWIGFHGDFAKPSSDDPVDRESSLLSCMVCTATQSSYDPNFIRTLIPGPAYLEEALQQLFGVTPEEFDDPEAKELFADASVINHVTEDAPPVHLGYTTPRLPFDDSLSMGAGIHHPRFGEILKEKMDGLGRKCVLVHREEFPDLSFGEVEERLYQEDIKFLVQVFHI